MVGFACGDGGGAVEGFGHEEHGEVVGEGEVGEAPEVVGLCAELVGVSVGAADGEGEFAVAVQGLGFEVGGELFAGVLCAAWVEEDEGGFSGGAGDGFAFGLLGFAGDAGDLDFVVAAQAFLVFVPSGAGVGEFGFADGDEVEAHEGQDKEFAGCFAAGCG